MTPDVCVRIATIVEESCGSDGGVDVGTCG